MPYNPNYHPQNPSTQALREGLGFRVHLCNKCSESAMFGTSVLPYCKICADENAAKSDPMYVSSCSVFAQKRLCTTPPKECKGSTT